MSRSATSSSKMREFKKLACHRHRPRRPGKMRTLEAFSGFPRRLLPIEQSQPCAIDTGPGHDNQNVLSPIQAEPSNLQCTIHGTTKANTIKWSLPPVASRRSVKMHARLVKKHQPATINFLFGTWTARWPRFWSTSCASSTEQKNSHYR